MKVLVLHGPNLNLLGERQPEIYGSLTLEQLDARIRAKARELEIEVRIFQSNHEGALIDRIHAERHWMDALVINPAAYTHYSYAIRDAIAGVAVRAIEVHLSDIHAREPWRRISVIAEVCAAQITGLGAGSYLQALEQLASGQALERRASGPGPRQRKETPVEGPPVRKGPKRSIADAEPHLRPPNRPR